MRRGILVISACILAAILIFLSARNTAYKNHEMLNDSALDVPANTLQTDADDAETGGESAGTDSDEAEISSDTNQGEIEPSDDFEPFEDEVLEDTSEDEELAENASQNESVIEKNITDSENTLSDSENEMSDPEGRTVLEDIDNTESEKNTGNSDDNNENTDSGEKNIMVFLDAFKEVHQAEIDTGVKKHDYDLSCFKIIDEYMHYDGDARYTYRTGIDVSHHDGDIDWKSAKEAGIEFAILRIGYRGYGAEGLLNEDKKFREYIVGAKEAGLDVGCYIFSQAINVEEAEEEAQLVLDVLKDYEIDLPVVYDPESILEANARTDYVSGEQFTENAVSFCEKIRAAGYQPMIYCNMMWEAYELDLKKLSDYPIWYADYEPLPQTPYRFDFWQYSNSGVVPGISDSVDLDIQLIPQNVED